MVIVTIRPWKNFNTSKQLIAIERKIVGLFGCCLLESCIVCYLTACLILPWQCIPNADALSVIFRNILLIF